MLNPNNYKYHDGLRAALLLQPDAQGRWTDQQRWLLTVLYKELAEQHPSSSAIRRIPLDFKVRLSTSRASCVAWWVCALWKA